VAQRQDFATDPVAAEDAAAGFSSGKRALDTFFRRHAFDNDQRGIGRTFVLRSGGAVGLPALLGFYTLCMASIEVETVPATQREKLPTYPMPVALIGRLAVDRRAQGRGYGAMLLRDALQRVLLAAASVGCYGVIVDAKDDQAATFYERYGFVQTNPGGGFPRRMFLAIQTARASLAV